MQSREVKGCHFKVFRSGEYTLGDLTHLLKKPERTVRHWIDKIGLSANDYGVYSELDLLALQGWMALKQAFGSKMDRYSAWLRSPVNPEDPNSPKNYEFMPQYVQEAKRRKKPIRDRIVAA